MGDLYHIDADGIVTLSAMRELELLSALFTLPPDSRWHTFWRYEGFFWLISIWTITSWLQIVSCGCRIALFVGSYIEGYFFGVSSFTKVCLYSYDYYDNSLLIADARFANANCDFFVNFQKHCYVLAFPVGYLLRASFFKTTFNFRHRHCCKVPPSIGCPVDQRYFNQAATSTIFSKNFLTDFFFRLYFGRFRWLVSRGIIFRKP